MRPLRLDLPPMTIAIIIALSSAADCFVQDPNSRSENQESRVIVSGHLNGTSELQHIVIRKRMGEVHLVIQTGGSHQQVLWQTKGEKGAYRVDSVRIADLNADGFPEIISLWWNRSHNGARLRIVHWDRQLNSFVELQPENEINGVISYRVVRTPPAAPSSRILIEMQPEERGRPRNVEYEVRESRLMRVGGDNSVTASQGESGIEGQTLISPVRPGPQRQGDSNTAPYKTALVVWSTSGNREIMKFETGVDGRFRVALAPGAYRIGPPPQTGRFQPRASEETVVVKAGTYANITISFDSGMR